MRYQDGGSTSRSSSAESPLADQPWAIKIDPAGETLNVAHRYADTISVVNLVLRRVIPCLYRRAIARLPASEASAVGRGEGLTPSASSKRVEASSPLGEADQATGISTLENGLG